MSEFLQVAPLVVSLIAALAGAAAFINSINAKKRLPLDLATIAEDVAKKSLEAQQLLQSDLTETRNKLETLDRTNKKKSTTLRTSWKRRVTGSVPSIVTCTTPTGSRK